MKQRWTLLKILVLLIAFVFLLVFAQNSYEKREITKSEIKIDYSNGSRFINNKLVNQLFGKTHIDYPKMALNKVQVSEMEALLNQNEFIEKANVYLENNGVLYTEISQKKPVLRVKNGSDEYYITDKGKRISLSNEYSSRVYIIEGKINESEYLDLVNLVKTITEDKLLKNIVVGIRKEKVNSYILLVENENYFVELGSLKNISNKLNNFKVFYMKYIQQTSELPYKKININFNNQVIAIR